MKCCVKKCRNDNHTKSKKISFHRFPTAEWKREKWMEILQLDGIKPSAIVCSIHFHESDFITDGPKNKKRLFPSAMPCLNMKANVVNPIEEVLIEEYEEADIQSPNSLRAQSVERAIVNDEDEFLYEEPICSKSVKQNIDHGDLPPIEPSSEETSLHPHQYQILEIDKVLPLASRIDRAEIDSGISKKKNGKMSLKKALCSSDDGSSDDLSADDTSSSNFSPQKQRLKLKVKTLRKSVAKYKLKLKTLNQTLRRKTKKIASLNETISNLKSKNSCN